MSSNIDDKLKQFVLNTDFKSKNINFNNPHKIKEKNKDILSESSNENENENNNNSQNNYEPQNNFNEKNKNFQFSKEIIDINDDDYNNGDEENNNNYNNNIVNNIKTLKNNFFNQNKNYNNYIINNNNNNNNYNIDNNVSRSMSSQPSNKSSPSPKNKNLSRSRSRSLSPKYSPTKNNNYQINQNFHNIQNNNNNYSRNNNRNLGNKFQNLKNISKKNNSNIKFVMKNGCCRDCMKAFSKNGKSCLCQVPRKERKFHLSENGCNFCGCKGCNPIDVKFNERKIQKSILYQDKNLSHKNQRILDSEDEDLKIKENDVDNYNIEKRELKDDLNDILKINSIFYGHGVPLRTPSYILGYNPNYNNTKKK